MKKYLIAVGLVLALVLAAPTPASAQSLNVAQLRAIIASLQAQLNVLIAKLQLQIQQQNNPTPTPTSQPSITIISPNGGESWVQGSTHDITWNYSGFQENTSVKISLLDKLGGYTIINNYSARVGSKSYQWTVPVDSWANFSKIKIELCEKTSCASDDSDNYFTIASAAPSLKASLNVTALDGAIQCFRAPCEFPLSGAQVTVYDANKVLVGSKVVDNTGLASFVNLNPGTYTVYVSASGYTKTSGQAVGLVSGQTGSVKIPVFLSR